MRLFSVFHPDDLVIQSWIAVKHNWKAAHLKVPWFHKSRLVLAWEWPFRLHVFSSRREVFFDDEGSSVPGYGPPRSASGRIIGSPIYGENDHICSLPTKGCAGVED